MEQTSEVTAGHGRSLGETVYGKIVAEMREDPRGKISKTVGRLDLKLECLKSMFMFTGPLTSTRSSRAKPSATWRP